MSGFRRIFFTLVALAFIQVIYYYPRMPAVVASHFDGRGAPNDWVSREGFFGLYLVIILLLVAVFEFVPRWSESRSGFGRKIPNRDYWLAPERIAQTRAFFRRQMFIIGILHMMLSMFAIQLAILANFDPEPRLHSSISWALILYFIFLGAWLVHFYLHFQKL